MLYYAGLGFNVFNRSLPTQVLHLCLALANLVRTGNEDAIALGP